LACLPDWRLSPLFFFVSVSPRSNFIDSIRRFQKLGRQLRHRFFRELVLGCIGEFQTGLGLVAIFLRFAHELFSDTPHQGRQSDINQAAAA
jgi:hypothetical protein